jgi:hypothetical protein
LNTPRFTAEASLYKTRGHYYIVRTHAQATEAIYPAYLDKVCYDACWGNCLNECFDKGPSNKSYCVEYCKPRIESCLKRCTKPDPPKKKCSCPPGFSCCDEGSGCCPPGSSCCGPGCCRDGHPCCAGKGCCPEKTFCCAGKGCCDDGTTCVDLPIIGPVCIF